MGRLSDGTVSLDDRRANNQIAIVGNPVVHFEIIGKNPAALKEFYRALFGWEADADSPVAPQVSDAGAYGFIASSATADGSAIPGGIGAADRALDHTRSSTSGSRMWLPRSRRP
jgi:predicted enzyme related to lactoylglutathione lyase